MATLQYKSSLGRYRRYLQSIQNQPLLKASLFLILSLSLVIGLIAMALRPTLSTIAGLIGQIQQERQLEKQLDAKINTLKDAQIQLTLASARLTYLNDAIPTSAHAAVWADSLSRVASESGVQVDSVVVTGLPVARVSESMQIPFKIAATGGYPQLYQFLQVLQNLRRLIKIDTVDIARPNTEVSTVLLNISGSLTVSP